MSVYINTECQELRRCLDSIQVQSVKPTEIVIVLDGPVKPDVKRYIEDFKNNSLATVKVLEFEQNRGLGAALADGLSSCETELVARVDTDDICLTDRFETQLQCFEDNSSLSVVGAQLEERYSSSSGETRLTRHIPIGQDEFARVARYRNPVNHQTVMFRRDDVLSAGNYQSVLWFEDYFLWARMLMMGYKFYNIDKILVRAEANTAYFNRRGGIAYLKHEIELAKLFRRIGFHNWLQSAKFILSRALIRVAPVKLRTRFYFSMLRESRSRQSGD